ncbi:MAG: helix-turn-helix domain-containing protein [Armatimonadetes bacterium]|nr:helix-turn-helix domain-containing protein [Armatimonadota bacterium]
MNPEPPDSLGKAKPEHFGEALRSAYLAEFGSQREFARAVGVTPGRISQLVNGREEVEAQTLGRLLACLSSTEAQERVHAAWTEQFAPLPETTEDAADPAKGLARILDLTEAGLPVRALELAKLWRGRAAELPEWQAFSGQAVELSLRLNKVSSALAVVQEMEQAALQAEDAPGAANALWLKGLVMRNLDRAAARMVHDAHQDAVDFAKARGVTSTKLPGIEEQLARDFALHLVLLHERKPLPREALEVALGTVSDSVSKGLDGVLLAHALEIRARVEIALGQVAKAEDTLDEVREVSVSRATDVSESILLSGAKIRLARGEDDEAKTILEQVAEMSFERMNLHHQEVAEQLLAKVMLGDVRRGPQ